MTSTAKAVRLWVSVLIGAYVTIMMTGGSAFWIARVAGVGEGDVEYAVRGFLLAVLTVVGLIAGFTVGRYVWTHARG